MLKILTFLSTFDSAAKIRDCKLDALYLSSFIEDVHLNLLPLFAILPNKLTTNKHI